MSKDVNVTMADLHVQMKITNKLIAAQLKDKLQQKDFIRLLMNTGASDRDIADVLGTTAATVKTTKARVRKDSSEK